MFVFNDECFDKKGDILCEETFNTSSQLFNLGNDGNDALNSDVNIKTRVVDSPVLGERKEEKYDELFDNSNSSNSNGDDILMHGLQIEYGRICHIVKLPISMIRPFPLVNNSHITLYPQLEIIWKVSKSLRKYWGKYGQISFYIISCITHDCIIVEYIFLV